MNTKHTPGPWSVDQDDRPGMEWNRHIVSGDNAICFMAHSDGKDQERDESNARLIAAAPDLLSALIYIQAFPNAPKAHRCALDAIKKAT